MRLSSGIGSISWAGLTALLEIETVLGNTEKARAEGRIAVNPSVFYRALLQNEIFF